MTRPSRRPINYGKGDLNVFCKLGIHTTPHRTEQPDTGQPGTKGQQPSTKGQRPGTKGQ